MTAPEPFLLCRLPGERILRRFDFSERTPGGLKFCSAAVRFWPGTTSRTMEVCPESTPEDKYLSDIAGLKETLKATHGKTVICRQICGEHLSFDIEKTARAYFDLFPDMFCFLFYHPATKWWMGASPELLLESTSATTAQTRALAGTRPADDGDGWSDKNIAEHKFVVNDITARLGEIEPHVSVTAQKPYPLDYGDIQHLCTPISIVAEGRLPFDAIVRAIHPTPAVCGYPRQDAEARIGAMESWPRLCYGGYIILPTDCGNLAYVILRCVHFDGRRWAIYTGSGITGDSDARDEWNETAAKAAPLVRIFAGHTPENN